MDTVSQLMRTIWGAIVVFAQQVEASRWFPLLVVAAALSVLLGIINFAITVARRPSGDRRAFRVLWIEFRFLITDEFLPIVGLWFAFATPFDRLPFTPPSLTDHWLFLPAHTTYVVIAVLAHGILSLWGTIFLTSGWLTQLRTPDEGRFDVLVFALALLAMVWGWEAQRWPELFLVSFEFILTFIVATLADVCAVGIRQFTAFYTPGNPAFQQPSVKRILDAVFVITMTPCLLLIVLWHQIDWYVVTLVALFFILTRFDLVVSVWFGAMNYRRAFFLVPLALIMTFLSASGALRFLTYNSSVSYTLWLEVGVATAAYMLLHPLTEMARRATGPDMAEKAVREFTMFINAMAVNVMLRESKPAPDTVIVDADPSADNTESDKQVQRTKDGPPEGWVSAVRQMERTVRMAAQPDTKFWEEALKVPVWPIVLITALIFHYFANVPDVLAGLGGNLLTVVFGVLSLFAGLLSVLASQEHGPARDVLLLVLMLTMGVIAGDVVLNFNPIASGLVTTFPASMLSAIQDQHYILATIHSICQELLVLLAVGEITYLFIVVNANLSNYENMSRNMGK